MELSRDFLTLLAHTSDFIYFKDQDSRIRFCSQAMASLCGYRDWREMIGKHDFDITVPQEALYLTQPLGRNKDFLSFLEHAHALEVADRESVRVRGNQTKAAEQLGLQRTFLNRLIKEYGL
jgi:PAS domain-containing protein